MPTIHQDSIYSFVSVTRPQDWDLILGLCEGHLLKHALEQLRSALGGSCRTIVVEREYVCKDYRDTYNNWYAKKFATYPDKCHRLLFFRDAIEPDQWWQVPDYAESFIGYSVVRPTRIRCLGRTILDPGACDGVSGYMCLQHYTANLMGTCLEVEGFPLISQDSDVTICAHAACWMCFRYFSSRYSIYREIYPYQVTQLTVDFSDGRLLPSRGITMYQVAEMFSRFGFFPQVYIREEYPNFDRLLYCYIESGLPVLLGLPEHAAVAFGHLSDLSTELSPGLNFSSSYVSGLVINDDNYMPYQCLPRSPDQALSSHHSDFSMSDIDSFVVPLPEKVYLTAQDIERLTLALIGDPDFGLELHGGLDREELVLRIFLTTSEGYKRFRRNHPPGGPGSGLDRFYTQLPMPKFIWVSELSTRSIYPQGMILGEILWDATATGRDVFSWLLIHYPERLVANDRNSHKPRSLIDVNLEPNQPYNAYRHNLHTVP